MTGAWKFVIPTILTLFTVRAVMGGDTSSGGGGLSRIYFEEGRAQAVQLLSNIQSEDFPVDTPTEVKEFLIKYSKQMAADLVVVPLEWLTHSPQLTCAQTKYEPGATLFLSYEKCYGYMLNKYDAGKLLVHEISHHFGIKEETFADLLGIHLYRAWETKQLVELSLCPEKRPIAEALAGTWQLDVGLTTLLPGIKKEALEQIKVVKYEMQFIRDLNVLKTFKVRQEECVYDSGIMNWYTDGKITFGPVQYVLLANKKGYTTVNSYWVTEKGNRRDESNIVSLLTSRKMEGKSPVLLFGGDHEDEPTGAYKKISELRP